MPLMKLSILAIAIFCVLNLLLTYGVIRRLRLHSERLARQETAFKPSRMAVRSTFVAKAVGGREISYDTLRGSRVVAFLSPGCRPCEELLPKLARAIKTSGVSPDQVFAVISSGEDGEGEDAYLERLAPISTVVSRDQASIVAAAFGVRGYPFICSVSRDGSLTDLGRDERTLERVMAG